MAYNVFVDVPESTEEGLAFLTWLPRSELKQALNEQKDVCQEEMRKDGLREKLIESGLYEHNKAKLAKMYPENNLSTIGTKLDLAERLAKHLGVNLDHETPLYVGDLNSIQIRRLSAAKLRAILQFHNVSTLGTKDQLTLKVSLLRANRRHLIHSNELKRLLELINITNMLISREVELAILYGTPILQT